MLVGRIDGATRVLGISQGYEGLPVRDSTIVIEAGEGPQEYPVMSSAWLPTPEELAMLNAGASIHIHLLGTTHPPMKVEIGPVPE